MNLDGVVEVISLLLSTSKPCLVPRVPIPMAGTPRPLNLVGEPPRTSLEDFRDGMVVGVDGLPIGADDAAEDDDETDDDRPGFDFGEEIVGWL
ncbi:hypothetical protein HDU67_007039 [Dinochytrium kinnereticum]|nr:hypothetical protein HDU67_007039 [Dinochytrium kinnereticum]